MCVKVSWLTLFLLSLLAVVLVWSSVHVYKYQKTVASITKDVAKFVGDTDWKSPTPILATIGVLTGITAFIAAVAFCYRYKAQVKRDRVSQTDYFFTYLM